MTTMNIMNTGEVSSNQLDNDINEDSSINNNINISHNNINNNNNEQHYYKLINDYKRRYARQRRRNLMKRGILYTYFLILIFIGVILYLMTNRVSSFFTFVFLNSIVVVFCSKNCRCCSNRSSAALQPAVIIAPAPQAIYPAVWTVPSPAIQPMSTYYIVDPNHSAIPIMHTAANNNNNNNAFNQNMLTTVYPAPSVPISVGLPVPLQIPQSLPPPYSVKDNYAVSYEYPVQLPSNPDYVQFANNQPGTSYKS